MLLEALSVLERESVILETGGGNAFSSPNI